MSSLLRRSLVVITAASVVLLFATTVLAQGSWVKKAPFPEADEEMYGVTAGGKIYVIGGYGVGGDPRGVVYEYDDATDQWTKKTSMPLGVHHGGLVEHNGKIYLFGGFARPTSGSGWMPVTNAWEFDPVADSWTALPPMPTKRGSPLAFVVDGKFYVIGGASTHPGSKDLAITGGGPARSVDTNEMFDPATNTWQTRQTLPTARNHAYGGVVNGKIYFIGGRLGHSFITVTSNTDLVEEYDPATDSWGALKSRMPTARSGGGYATYNGKIYTAGGEVFTPEMAGAFRAVEVYDPATDSWSKLPPMPMPRHGVAMAILNNRLHLISGGITTAAAGAGQDKSMVVHTTSHDVLELPR
jgi:N-acetylneuraminic acid mutarotase